jgi:phospholipid/cholesterol/gamma-HCH transport system ATP-binding protein
VTTAASQIRPSSSASSPERGKDIIRFSGVRKAFGPQVVLDGLDLAFTEGKTTVVLGPSGSGKSVMLKHIVGLLRPDLGRVDFDGTRIDTLDEEALIPFRLQIGFLFQMAALFDSMTVEENISFPLVEHTRLTAAQRRDRVRDALKVVDLEGVERKLPSQLSGGQRKRVGLARAIVTEPRVVLYDEPTTGLDPIRSDGINELILKLRRTLGVTGIVVTHDLTSARKVADRVVMLLNGRIAADGTFAQLESSPDPRVQHFLAGQYSREDDDALSKDAPPDEEPAPGTPASPPTPPSGLTS